jgi:predicted nucleic acid-binding Zn ribbon protein
MPSAFAPCRACGKPVYVGARRCPNCRALTSWRSRLRSKSFLLLILLLAALIIADIALYGWPGQSKPRANNRSQAPGLPARAAALPVRAENTASIRAARPFDKNPSISVMVDLPFESPETSPRTDGGSGTADS